MSRQLDNRPLTVTVDEAARMLGVSRLRVYDMLERGVLPARRYGRPWIISRRRLEAWIRDEPMAQRLHKN